MHRKLTVIVILAIISVALTFFSPLAIETTEGIFNTYSKQITLFGGLGAPGCVIVTVLSGLSFILFSCATLAAGKYGEACKGAKISGVLFLIMQISSILQALQYYDDSSVLGALRSEVSYNTVHPIAVVSVLLSIVATVFCFKVKKWEEAQYYQPGEIDL